MDLYRATAIVSVNRSLTYRMIDFGSTADEAEKKLAERIQRMRKEEGEVKVFEAEVKVVVSHKPCSRGVCTGLTR